MDSPAKPATSPVSREEAIDRYRSHIRPRLTGAAREAADERLEWDTVDGHPVLRLGFNKEFSFTFHRDPSGYIRAVLSLASLSGMR